MKLVNDSFFGTNGNDEIECMFVNNYIAGWSDQGSGADTNFSSWIPIVPDGFYALGHFGWNDYNAPDWSIVVIRSTSPMGAPNCPIAFPVDYKLVYSDQGSNSDSDGSIWEPIPPQGYKAMGCVTNISYDKPSLQVVVCVREDLVIPAKVGDPIWADNGSKGDQNVSLYRISEINPMWIQRTYYVTSGSFCGHASYDPLAQSDIAYALNIQMDSVPLLLGKHIDVSNWVSLLSGRQRLIDMVWPCSHDSASRCTGGPSTKIGILDPEGSVTQLDNILSQLRQGIRYFDLRIQKHFGSIQFHHGISNGIGPDADVANVFEHQIKPFINDHPGEIFVFDISVNDDTYDEIIDLFRTHLNAEQWASREHMLPSGDLDPAVNIGTFLSFGRKYIVTWDSTQHTSLSTGSEEKIPWISYNDRIRLSPFDDNVYKKERDTVPDYLDNQCFAWKRDKLLISQVIVDPIFSPDDKPEDLNKKYFDMLQQWTLKHGCGSNVNVILRDYIDSTPSILTKIINLNIERYKNILFYCNERGSNGNFFCYPGSARLEFGSDGNLVFYKEDGTPKWASGTQHLGATDVVMEPDGNLVFYDETSPVWQSYTGGPGNEGSYLQVDLETETVSIRRMDGTLVKMLS